MPKRRKPPKRPAKLPHLTWWIDPRWTLVGSDATAPTGDRPTERDDVPDSNSDRPTRRPYPEMRRP